MSSDRSRRGWRVGCLKLMIFNPSQPQTLVPYQKLRPAVKWQQVMQLFSDLAAIDSFPQSVWWGRTNSETSESSGLSVGDCLGFKSIAATEAGTTAVVSANGLDPQPVEITCDQGARMLCVSTDLSRDVGPQPTPTPAPTPTATPTPDP